VGSIQLIDEIHPQGRLVLHRQGAALLGRGVPEQGQGCLGNIDATGVARGFQAGINIDGVAPDVDAMFAQTAGDGWAGMYADADFPGHLPQGDAGAVLRWPTGCPRPPYMNRR